MGLTRGKAVRTLCHTPSLFLSVVSLLLMGLAGNTSVCVIELRVSALPLAGSRATAGRFREDLQPFVREDTKRAVSR